MVKNTTNFFDPEFMKSAGLLPVAVGIHPKLFA